MNKALIFATYDRAANRYGQVTLDISDVVARRNFHYAISESGALQYIAKDLELHKIGEIDLTTGDIVPTMPHMIIARGSEALNDSKE